MLEIVYATTGAQTKGGEEESCLLS